MWELPQLPQALPRTRNQPAVGGPERILGSFGVGVKFNSPFSSYYIFTQQQSFITEIIMQLIRNMGLSNECNIMTLCCYLRGLLTIEKRTIHQLFGVRGPIQLELENIIYLHITTTSQNHNSQFI